MKQLIPDKKGEKMYSFIWMFSFLIVGAVVVFVTLNYFSDPIDTREHHSKLLYEKLYSCFIEGTELKENIFDENLNLQESCNINLLVVENLESFYFYINLTTENKETKVFLERGPRVFRKDCSITEEIETKNYNPCFKRRIPVFYEGEKYFLEILTSSNNIGQRFGEDVLGIRRSNE